MNKISRYSLVLLFSLFTLANSQAEEIIYYEQMDHIDNGFLSYYPAGYPIGGQPSSIFQRCDNFIVPEGEKWNISKIQFYGTDFGSDIISFDVFFYTPAPQPVDDFEIQFPGAVLAMRVEQSFSTTPNESTLLFTITFQNEVVLNSGDYFLSIVARHFYGLDAPAVGGFEWTVHRILSDNPSTPGEDGSFSSQQLRSPMDLGWVYDINHDYTFRFSGDPVYEVIPLSNAGIILIVFLMGLSILITVRRFYG